MTAYAVDSKRQEMTATGIVDEVYEWVDDPASGKRKPSDKQARNEDTGMPLWNVEVMYRSKVFGKDRTVTAMVSVGAADRPEPGVSCPIRFSNLTVDAHVTKAGAFRESWRAEAIEETAAKTTRAAQSQPKEAAA